MNADDTVEEIKVVRQPHLKPQDAKTVDPSKLTALTPEVVSRTGLLLSSASAVSCCEEFGGGILS